MKKLLTLLLLFCSITIYGQNQKTYSASNGMTYTEGDTIMLGMGSMPNGDFKWLQMGGWAAAMSYNSNAGSSQFNIGKGYANTAVVLKKIKSYKTKGTEKYYFIVGGGNITNYYLYIEEAIETCEIKCKPFAQSNNIQSDKYDQLKKIKELFDNGVISSEEYEKEKQKLLNQ